MAGETSNIADGQDILWHYLAPAGSIIMYAGGPSEPTGWLQCDGQAVSRSTYSSLFSAIGTVYGIGDGSTTFNLPDLRGRSPLGANDAALPNGEDGGLSTRNEADEGGAETHALSVAELASHKHTAEGCNATYDDDGDVMLDAAIGSSEGTETDLTGSGTAHENMHPFTTVNFIIKT